MRPSSGRFLLSLLGRPCPVPEDPRLWRMNVTDASRGPTIRRLTCFVSQTSVLISLPPSSHLPPDLLRCVFLPFIFLRGPATASAMAYLLDAIAKLLTG